MRGALVALALLFTLGRAEAADSLKLKTPGVLTTSGGSRVDVAVGSLVLAPREVARIDAEVKRLQDAETRLSAENDRLKVLTDDKPVHTLKVAGLGLLVGVAVGFFVRQAF